MLPIYYNVALRYFYEKKLDEIAEKIIPDTSVGLQENLYKIQKGNGTKSTIAELLL